MNIQEQIEALTQELRPPFPEETFYYFDTATMQVGIELKKYPEYDSPARVKWREFNFTSTNEAEVEEYADCYRRLKLYQLLGKKSMKSDPEAIEKKHLWTFYGTDFYRTLDDQGCIYSTPQYRKKLVLGGVWFAREEDRLNALKICGITKEMQEKCAKYGLGGA